MFNTEGLKRQAKCYLACLNSLSLVNEKYAWIVKPNLRSAAERVDYELPSLAPGVSPKRNFEGEEIIPRALVPKPKLEVLERAQIERDFELVSSRLKLTKRSRDGRRDREVSGSQICQQKAKRLRQSMDCFGLVQLKKFGCLVDFEDMGVSFSVLHLCL